MRRLPEFAIVAYDRRGYQGSREAGVVGLQGHIGDLVEILSSVRSRGATSVSAIGHSFGGDVVIGAALTDPELCDSVGAFEPPMPWLGVGRAGGDHRHGAGPRWPRIRATRLNGSSDGWSARRPGSDSPRPPGPPAGPMGPPWWPTW